MTFDDFLPRLYRVHRRGDQADAQCPAHTDRTSNSLSVGVDQGGRILIKCFAGCTAEAVVGELGLTLSDLFPKGGRRNLDGVGLTLAELALAKRLPVDFLKDLGVADGSTGRARRSDSLLRRGRRGNRAATQPTKGAVSAPEKETITP